MALYLTKMRLIVFGSVAGVVILSAVLFMLGILGGGNDPIVGPVKLEVWGIFQDRDLMEGLARSYMKAHQNVTIEYKGFGDSEFTDYEPAIVKTLAEGDGPDIFYINNTWLPRHIGKLVSAPRDLLSADDVRQYFVDVVAKDFVAKDPDTGVEATYGAPLSLDTLALFYNKEMFNSASIASPPATWTEFQEVVQKLAVKDSAGNVLRAGAAIGTANNILRSTDILSLLMIQNGTKMVDDNHSKVEFLNNVGSVRPGPAALAFYVQFASPSSAYYTWNRRMHFSVDAFYERQAAMMFGYAYNVDTIRKKAPYLDFGIAPVPQISVAAGADAFSYANYWSPVVTKKTLPGEYKNLGCTKGSVRPPVAASPCWYAWDFITSMLADKPAREYLETTQRPAAQRHLIEWQRDNAGQRLAIFATQGIFAKSWYQPDSSKVEQFMAAAIDAVQLRNVTVDEALKDAVDQMNALLAKQRSGF